MVELYAANTFNSTRVSIMLEETVLSFLRHQVRVAELGQRNDNHFGRHSNGTTSLSISHDGESSDPIGLKQSAAILFWPFNKPGCHGVSGSRLNFATEVGYAN